MTGPLTEIIDKMDALIADLRRFNKPSPDVAADRNEPAPPRPKFAPGQRVRVVRDTRSVNGNSYKAGEILFVRPHVHGDCKCPDNRTIAYRNRTPMGGDFLLTADLEAIPDEPAKPEPPAVPRFKIGDPVELISEAATDDTEEMLNESADILFCMLDAEEAAKEAKGAIDPANLPERTPVVVVVSVIRFDMTSEYVWGNTDASISENARSIPIGWDFIVRDGEVVLRGPSNQIMTARDVYEKEEWSVNQ